MLLVACIFLISFVGLCKPQSQTQSCQLSVSQSVFNGLQSLYSSTNRYGWIWNTPYSSFGQPWNFTALTNASEYLVRPCGNNWQGVSCNALNSNTCNVVGLSLGSRGLSGRLPTNINLLSGLVNLSLPDNTINGAIPTQLGMLTTLQHLDLSDNAFSFTSLPPQLFNLANLTYLNVSSNFFFTSIPSQIGQLSQLKYFDGSGCLFTKLIPTQIGNLSLLQHLDLSGNFFGSSLPNQLGSLQDLVTLDVDGSLIFGTLPTEIAALPNLQLLDLHSNYITGTIPMELGSLSALEILNLAFNFLQVAIPTTLGQCTNLLFLAVAYNYFESTLPTELGNLSKLISLFVQQSSLTGTIPTELGNLQPLQYFELEYNFLTGILPTELYALTRLQKLSVSKNSIHGSLSTLIGNLIALSEIDFHGNSITGTLPTEVGLLHNLTYVDFSSNRLSGPLPAELFLSSNLEYINCGVNNLVGSIPWTIGNLVNLTTLRLDLNSLVGSIPTELGQCLYLHELYVVVNQLTGTLPTELGQLSNLEIINIGSNSISGTLPSQLGQLHALTLLDVTSNPLTGIIPSQICMLTKVARLLIAFTLISGTIPAQIGSMSNLLVMNLGYNLLTSTLPNSLYNLLLTGLGIANNHLTGTVSHAISNFSSLYQFAANSNSLSGPLSLVFPSHVNFVLVNDNMFTGPLFNISLSMQGLQWLSFADNAFTGTFPSTVLGLNNLTVLAASSNCFHGELTCPATVGKSLQTLSLSGLSSGFICRKSIISSTLFPNKGYLPEIYMQGPIPSCLWSFPSLQALYLVGNGFTGPLMSESVNSLPPSLINLSVAFNQLTGTIPSIIQSYAGFLQLDLSHNKFQGVVEDRFMELNSVNSLFNIAVNRLSGSVAVSSLDWGDAVGNILKGNLFTFSTASLSVSEYSEASVYQGSTTLDIAVGVSSTVIAAVLFIAVTYVASVLRYVNDLSIIQWWNELSFITQVRLSVLEQASKLFPALLLLASVSLLFFFVLFPSLKSDPSYSTHSFQYGWAVASVYLHGIAPVVLIAMTLNIILVVASVLLVNDKVATRSTASSADLFEGSSEAKDDAVGIRKSYMVTGKVALAIIIDALVIIPVNIGYLIAVLNNTSSIQMIQFAVSIFRGLWGSGYPVVALQAMRFADDSQSLFFRFAVELVNSVMIPLLATSLVSASCFVQLFEQAPAPVTVSYICGGNTDRIHNNTCLSDYVSVEGTFNPPFTYSYQCSSALISNYVPILLYSCFIDGFIVPSTIILLLRLAPDSLLAWCRNNKVVRMCIPTVLLYGNASNNQVSEAGFVPTVSLVAKLLLNGTLFLTFGLAFPYLGVVIVCSTFTEVAVWLTAVGKYRHCHRNVVEKEKGGSDVVDHIDKMLGKIVQMLPFPTKIDMGFITIVVWLFWGLVCFDMVADVIGYRPALISMLLIIFVGPVATLIGVWLIGVQKSNRINKYEGAAMNVLIQNLVDNEYGHKEIKSLSGHKISEMPL